MIMKYCECGIHYREELEIYIIDEELPISIKPSRCLNCGGLITDEQKKNRCEHITMAQQILAQEKSKCHK